jgi:hypothetical protein
LLSEEEIDVLKRHYGVIAKQAAKDGSIRESHSIEEARAKSEAKRKNRGTKA